jgi:hypothetical protein
MQARACSAHELFIAAAPGSGALARPTAPLGEAAHKKADTTWVELFMQRFVLSGNDRLWKGCVIRRSRRFCVSWVAEMVKAKPKAVIRVADGAGGMMNVEDRRFEQVNWPFRFEVPIEQEQADQWLCYLHAECHRRGWSASGLGQLERAENSGTIVVVAPGKPLLDIVWERRRGGPIKVRARLALSSELPLSEAEQFFSEVNDRCRSGATEPIYARGTLQYDGMAWRGELWLDDKVRLGPPSLQDETALSGPRVVHVDAILDCIGKPDVAYVREQTLLELSAFLSVVMRKAIRLPDQGRTWTWTVGANGCEVRNLGYMEIANPLTMPVRGADKPLPLYRSIIPLMVLTVVPTK